MFNTILFPQEVTNFLETNKLETVSYNPSKVNNFWKSIFKDTDKNGNWLFDQMCLTVMLFYIS